MLEQLLTHQPYRMVVVSSLSLLIYLSSIFFIRFIYPKKKIPYPILLLGISFLPIISIFREGTYESGDINIHITRTMSFYKALQEGVIIPRWAGELNATYGYALFEFIYPLPYYISSFYHFLGFSFLDSVKLLLISTYITSGFAMFAWLKNHVSEKNAFLGSIFYLFAPYHLVDMHFRSNVGEMLAFVFLPLSLFMADKYIKRRNSLYIFLLGISFALLILSHPAISLLGSGLIFIYIIYVQKGSKKTLILKSLVPLLLGILFSSFYWIPANVENSYILADVKTSSLGFLSLSELLYSKWRYGLLFQGPYGELSFVLGYAHWLAIILAIYIILFKKVKPQQVRRLWESLLVAFGERFPALVHPACAGRSSPSSETRGILKQILKNNSLFFFTIVLIIYIFLLLENSKIIWQSFSFLRNMRLTYRVLSIVALLSSAVASLVSEELKNKKMFLVLIIVAIGTTILNWGNRKNLPDIKDEEIEKQLPFSKERDGCWAILTSPEETEDRCQDEIPTHHIEALDGGLVILDEKRTTTNHSYVVNMKNNGLVKENTSYFPGWKLYVNGLEKNISYDSEQFPGIITFNLEEGKSHIVLSFENTKFRKYSFYLSTFSLLFSGIYLILSCVIYRKKAPHKSYYDTNNKTVSG